MNHRIANAIKTIGQFHFMSDTATMEKRKDFPATRLRIPRLVSLQALRFPTRSIKSPTTASDYAKLAAHLHVRFGLFALKSLYFWEAFQVLRSLLNGNPDMDPKNETLELVMGDLLKASTDAGIVGVEAEPIDALLRNLRRRPLHGPSKWGPALEIMQQQIEPIASRHFGITTEIQRGPTEVPGLSYEQVYRMAVHAGVLRARLIAKELVDESAHETLRSRYELRDIFNRLSVYDSIPHGAVELRKAIRSLADPEIRLSSHDVTALFTSFETFLDAFFGGQAGLIYLIAYEAEFLCLALCEPARLGELIRDARGNLVELCESLEDAPIAALDEFVEAASRKPITPAASLEQSAALRETIHAWLRRVAPMDEGGEEMLNKRIFLSHKSVNKTLVRRFRDALIECGFQPWLDADEMRAGDVPLRAIHRGLEKSCPAVFFITPEFQDERWLSEEIDYALDRKRKEGDKFSVITLVFREKGRPRPVVPSLLKRYVYKEPSSELDALAHIVRALPIKPGAVQWK